MYRTDQVTIRNSHLHSNQAEEHGGGIKAELIEKFHIENSIISTNSVDVNDGGGISTNNIDTTIIIIQILLLIPFQLVDMVLRWILTTILIQTQ